MSIALIGWIALLTAGAAILGHGVVRAVTGRAAAAEFAYTVLIGAGIVVIGGAAAASADGALLPQLLGLALVTGGVLIRLRTRKP